MLTPPSHLGGCEEVRRTWGDTQCWDEWGRNTSSWYFLCLGHLVAALCWVCAWPGRLPAGMLGGALLVAEGHSVLRLKLGWDGYNRRSVGGRTWIYPRGHMWISSAPGHPGTRSAAHPPKPTRRLREHSERSRRGAGVSRPTMTSSWVAQNPLPCWASLAPVSDSVCPPSKMPCTNPLSPNQPSLPQKAASAKSTALNLLIDINAFTFIY